MKKEHKMTVHVILFASFLLLFPCLGDATTVTIESDIFLRCLIGECMTADSDPPDTIIYNPYGDIITGTDLGMFARGLDSDALSPTGYTYMFLGDTNVSGTGWKDVYLKIPNNMLGSFIKIPTEGMTEERATEFSSFLQHEYFVPVDYLYGSADLDTLNVPTGAFYNPVLYGGRYYVYYGHEMDGRYSVYNKDKSILLRDTFDDGYDIRTIQELLGHKEISTTMIYTHVLDKGGHGVRSPVDGL